MYALPVAALALLVLHIILQRRAFHRGVDEGLRTAQVDPSTRLPRLELARRILELEFAAAERGRSLVIVLFSLDNYRKVAVADRGAVGGRLLLGAGAILRKRTRGMNVSARLNEHGVFISILGDSSVDGAGIFAHKVRKDLMTLPSGPQALIVSACVCPYRAGMHSVDELIIQAEVNLDEAKQHGGNQVLTVGETEFAAQLLHR